MGNERIPEPEKIQDDRSIIVVSDLHLGSLEDPDTPNRFCTFLEKIRSADTPVSMPPTTGADSSTTADSCPQRLLPPAKIILLGDILELWDSRKQDRNNSFLDALMPFLKLRELPCDVIYVTGNHDEDVGEVVETVEKAEKSKESCLWKNTFKLFYGMDNGKKIIESLKIAWNPGQERRLEISPRHYPATTTGGTVRGVNAGGVTYAFIHGQQFDKEQITYTMSKATGHRIDIVDTLQDLANCSAAKNAGTGILIGTWITFILLSWLVFSPPVVPYSWIQWGVGVITVILLAYVFLQGVLLFGVSKKGLASSPTLFVTSGILLLAEMALVFGGWHFLSYGIFGYFFVLAFFIATYYFFVIALPKSFAEIKKTVYNSELMTWSVKNNSSQAIYRSALKADVYNYNAEVLVFGHTHIADYYLNEKNKSQNPDTRKQREPALLINAGTWVKGVCDTDSFVYIDKTGVALMRWVDNSEIRCIQHFPVEKILETAKEIRAKSSGEK